MDEAFDEFKPAKNKWVTGRNNGEPSRFGYAELFDRWPVRSSTTCPEVVLILNDRPLGTNLLSEAVQPAQRIELLPDVKELRGDGRDIGHLKFRIVDEHGVLVHDAASELTFTVDGPAKIIGIENGDLNSPATGKEAGKAYRGRGLAFVQSAAESGEVRLTARAPGLKGASVKIEVRQ